MEVNVQGLVEGGFLDLDELFDSAEWGQVRGGPVASYVYDAGDRLCTIYVVVQRAEVHGITAYRWSDSDDSGDYDHGAPTLDRGEAESDAEDRAAEQDETTDLSVRVADIVAEEWFVGSVTPSDIESICRYATGHSQGSILVDRDGRREWVTSGYVECRHVRIRADYDCPEMAAEALLEAIRSEEEERGRDAAMAAAADYDR